MANEIVISDFERFSEVEGFHFRKDIRGNLTDVTLPRSYEIISKSVVSGILKKMNFIDNSGKHFSYQN